MIITRTEIYKYSIPMVPFTIATGTMHYAQNIFIRVHVDSGSSAIYGVGECSAFPMIVGETQATCYEMAKDFAAIWKGKDATKIADRMQDLHDYTAGNATIKSAFDMALYDLAAKASNQPLYQYLGGKNRDLETDLTIGIGTPEDMAATAQRFKADGVTTIKVKLGKKANEDIERIKSIRAAIGSDIKLRIDANQGWSFEDAQHVLNEIGKYDIQFCEQPMRRHNDHKLPQLIKSVPIKIMADESVFDHYEAERLIEANGCDYVNIKFAKSGGILEATKIDEVCSKNGIPTMMGGMLESRVALTAFAHFALAHDNVIFHDMDTCLLGHTEDPVVGGVRYKGYYLQIPDEPGIGADVDEKFLKKCVQTVV